MDTSLAIASRREGRRYADRRLPEDVLERVLDAGRLSGTANNRQWWRFVLVESPEARERLAETVYAGDHVRNAAAVIALVGSAEGRIPYFDAGRVAQNMLLAAWNEGLASTPNGMPEPGAAAKALGLGEDEGVIIVLTLGYPEEPRDPESRTRDDWSRRAKRLSLDELVRRV